MFLRTFTALALATLSATAAAQKIDINLSQDSARFTYISLIGGSTFGRTEMNIGVLYNEDKNSALDIGLHVIDVAGSKTPGLQVGVGPRLYYVTSDKPEASGASVALGGKLSYKFPSLQRLSLGASFYYAPSITSILDSENMSEFGLRVAYEILPTASAYIGHRNLGMSFDGDIGHETIDSTTYVGMDIAF